MKPDDARVSAFLLVRIARPHGRARIETITTAVQNFIAGRGLKLHYAIEDWAKNNMHRPASRPGAD